MKQSIGGESPEPGDIDEIRAKQIWSKWIEGKPMKQIASETGESIQSVYRTLASMQKAITEKIGVESHGKRKR